MNCQIIKKFISFRKSYQVFTRSLMYNGVILNRRILKPVPMRATLLASPYWNNFSQFNRNLNTLSVASKPDNKTDNTLFERIKFESISQKRVQLASVKEYLRLTSNVSEYSEQQVIDLITCVSTSLPNVPFVKRQEIVERVWAKKPKKVSESLLIAYLRACRSNKVAIDPNPYFSENCSWPVLQCLLEIACETGQINETNDIISKMKELDFPINDVIFATLIRGYSIAGDLKGVHATLETMGITKISASSVVYSELIQAFLKNGKELDAEKVLNEKLLVLKEENITDILLTALQTKASTDLIRKLVNAFSKDILQNHEMNSIFRNILSQLIVEGKFEEALVLLHQIPTPSLGSNEDFDAYGEFILKELLAVKCPLHIILMFCNLLKESGKNKQALQVATGIALKSRSDAAEPLLEALQKESVLRSHYFWPLLLKYMDLNGEAGIINVLKFMKKLNVDADEETLSFYVIPKLAVTFKNVEKGIKMLESIGVKTSNMLTPLTQQLLFQQRLNEVLYINNMYPTKLNIEKLIQPLVTNFSLTKSGKQTIPILAKLIKRFKDKAENQTYDFAGHFLVEIIANNKTKHEFKNIIEIIGELNMLDVKVSKFAAEMLSQHLNEHLEASQRQTFFKDIIDKRLSFPANEMIDNHIKHPRDMTLEDLQCHVAELESKGLNARGSLRRLLQLAIREEKLQLALEIKQKCDALKVDVSPGMQASIFDLYIKTGHVEEASKALNKLQNKFPGFLVDEHKIIDFAALLVQKGKISEAEKVIRMRAHTSTVKGGEYLSKNIWNLLNNIATIAPTLENANEKNHTREFFLLLNKCKYCGHQNTILGPILRELLNKNDLKNAVVEYISFCKFYKVTPLQRYLITLLVDASNNTETQQRYNVSESEARQMLHDVIEASTTVHGAASTNIAFIIALAEAGTEKQLRKMLIDPRARISPDILRKQCEFLNANRKLDTLVKLAKCSRGLGHIHEQEIYNMILDTLIKENDCKAAVVLFEQLISDDEFKVSNEFLSNLVDLLKRNNLELPTSVALYAK